MTKHKTTPSKPRIRVQNNVISSASVEACSLELAERPPVVAGQTDTVSVCPPPAAANEPPVDVVDGSTIPQTVNPTLEMILSWKRGYETKSELEFMTWLHTEIKARGHKSTVLPGGNISVRIPTKDNKASSALFSCHTDTTHSDEGRQKILYDPNFGHIFLEKLPPSVVTGAPPWGSAFDYDVTPRGKSYPLYDNRCLGADDGAGVWILLEMIKAGVPGTYIFHRGEERGCIGAKVLVDKCADLIESHDIAVAFDRRDTGDVIITQGGQECASPAFGQLLANALNAHGLQYKPSTNGMYTDVRVYRHLVSECINLSVGYADNHGPNETLDYGHLVKLRDAVLKIDWEALAKQASRVPEPAPSYTQAPKYWQAPKPAPVPAPKPAPKAQPTLDLLPEEELDGMTRADIEEWCADNPEEAASLMINMAAELAGMRATMKFLKGVV